MKVASIIIAAIGGFVFGMALFMHAEPDYNGASIRWCLITGAVSAGFACAMMSLTLKIFYIPMLISILMSAEFRRNGGLTRTRTISVVAMLAIGVVALFGDGALYLAMSAILWIVSGACLFVDTLR